jgi:hypothetical protein
MTKKIYPNPFELYINVMKHNIKTLDKLIEINELFSELSQKRIATLGNESKKLNSEVKIRDIKYYNFYETPSISYEDFVEPFLNDSNRPPGPINEPLEDFEEITYDSIQNSPISTFEQLSNEEIFKLNLFGIYRASDLDKYDISDISKNTGIPESELNQLNDQIRRFLP